MLSVNSPSISSPYAYDRRTSSASGPPNPALTADIPAAPAQAETLATLSTRLQDSLALSGNAPQALNQEATELASALNALQQLNGSGPDSSLVANLENFATETLPSKIEGLNQQLSDLRTQIENASPQDRALLETQIQAVQELLGLYQDAGRILQASPLLRPEPIQITAPPFDISASIESAIIPLETPKTPTSRSNYRAQTYDVFLNAPRSEETIFNQRRVAIDDQISQIDQAIEQLGADQPEELAKLQGLKTLMQELSTLYGGIQDLTKNGDAAEADVSLLADRIASATEALTAVESELDSESLDAIKGQLRDLTTVATEFLTMPRRPGNLGYTLNVTYKRRGEIQAGKRTRETPDIAGALKSYVNDQSDMATFVQRFGDLRSDIRSGRISPEAARARALASIPGTSQAFQNVFLRLIDSEISLAQAERSQQAAAAAAARGNENASDGESAADRARTANQSGGEANRQAQVASRTQDYGGATAQNTVAREQQQAGQAAIGEAQESLSAGQREAATARAELGHSAAAIASARRGADSAAASAYGGDLSDPISGVRGQASQVETGNRQVSAQVSALEDRLANLDDNLASLTAENQALDQNITETDQTIAEGLEAQQHAAQNQAELERLSELLSSGQSFEIELSARLKAGVDASSNFETSVSGGLVVKLTGKVNDDGSVSVDVALAGEISAEVKAFFEFEAKLGIEGTYGLRFDSPEKAREFARLLSNTVTTLASDGPVSRSANSARRDLFRFIDATDRTSVAVYAEGEAKTGEGADRRGVKGKVEARRVTQSTFDDANNNGRLDPGERVRDTDTLELTLESKVRLGNEEYEFVFKEVRDPQTNRLIGREIEIAASTEIKEELLELVLGQARSQGLQTSGLEIPDAGRRLTSAQSGLPQHSPASETRASAGVASAEVTVKGTTRLTISAEEGEPLAASISLESQTQFRGEASIPLGATELELEGKYKTTSSVTTQLIG